MPTSAASSIVGVSGTSAWIHARPTEAPNGGTERARGHVTGAPPVQQHRLAVPQTAARARAASPTPDGAWRGAFARTLANASRAHMILVGGYRETQPARVGVVERPHVVAPRRGSRVRAAAASNAKAPACRSPRSAPAATIRSYRSDDELRRHRTAPSRARPCSETRQRPRARPRRRRSPARARNGNASFDRSSSVSRASSSRERGPVTCSVAHPLVTSVTVAPRREAAAQQPLGAPLGERRRHDQEPVLVQPRHGRVHLDAAALVADHRVHDAAAARRRRSPRTGAAAPRARPGPAPGTSRTSTGRTARRPRGWRGPPRRTASNHDGSVERVAVPRGRRRRARTSSRAPSPRPRRTRRPPARSRSDSGSPPHAAPRVRLQPRPVHRVQPPERLHASARAATRGSFCPPAGARDVHLGQIHRGVAVDDPLGERPARRPGPKMMPWELKPGRDEQAGHLGQLAQLEVRVRREALRRAQVVREADRLAARAGAAGRSPAPARSGPSRDRTPRSPPSSIVGGRACGRPSGSNAPTRYRPR